MAIEEFRILMGEALEYSRQMEFWGAAFPDCSVYTYEETSNNISEFFLRNVLMVADLTEFEGLNTKSKIRLSRDVLEYKRMLNRIDRAPVEVRMNNFTCTRLNLMLKDDGQHHNHLRSDARVSLLRDLEHDCVRLIQRFGMKPFPPVSNEDAQVGSPYPGLSPETLRELREHHAQIKRTVSYRIEWWAQLIRHFIVKRLRVVAWIILPLGRFALRRHKKRTVAEVYGPRKRRPSHR
jgi:hypothetical protein